MTLQRTKQNEKMDVQVKANLRHIFTVFNVLAAAGEKNEARGNRFLS